MIVFYIILAIVILMLLVLVHELGHYVAGKLFKFKINEFSIGFGKALFSRTNKKTGEKFSIRLVPLGGYCAFDGEDEDGEGPTSFNKQKWWKRLIVLAMGAIFNIIFGLLTVVVMLMVTGYDKQVVTKVEGINSATIYTNDIICKVDGEYVNIFQSISSKLQKKNVDDKVVLQVIRDGEKINIEAIVFSEMRDDGTGKLVEVKILNIGTKFYQYNFWQALGQTFVATGNIIWETLRSFGLLISGQLSLTNLSGPFGIIGGIATGAKTSFSIIFAFIPIISINLGVFNLLPIPALDGARMVFVGIEAVRRKPISRKVEGMIHSIGLMVLFTFVILIDVVKLFI